MQGGPASMIIALTNNVATANNNIRTLYLFNQLFILYSFTTFLRSILIIRLKLDEENRINLKI